MATSVLARTVVLSLLSIAGQSKATVVTGNQLSITPSKDGLQLGDNLTLSCRWLSETDDNTITWKFNHEVIKGVNTRYTVLSSQDTDSEGARSILQISNIQTTDQGTYTCYGLGTTGGTAANYEMDLELVMEDEGMCRVSMECGPVKTCDDGRCVCPLGAISTQNGSCINSETQGRPTKCKTECGKGKTCNNGNCVCLPGYVPSGNDVMSCNERYPGSSGHNDDKKENDRVIVVNHTSVAAIVGSTMGALAMILLVIVGYICYRRRKKSQKLMRQVTNPYRDPNYLYQYEYHSEANLMKDNPTFSNPGYQVPPPKPSLRKENTYISMKRDELEFPREQLQLGVDLGEGRFGKVIQARAMNITGTGDWERVAVKTCRGLATDSEKEDLYQELEIMRKLPNHQNIVSLFGCCSRTDPLYIIMEYVQRGSLLGYIRKCRPSSRMSRGSMGSSITTSYSSFMEPRAKDLTIFALQIARGMAHVASCGIIHRDLAARNILLATDFTCKICDFGLARDVEGIDVYERTSKGPLPIRWMAPESLADNMFTRKSDVWSYGVLLWEIVTLGATPYPGKSAMEVMRQVLQGYLLQRPLHCKEEMYELMLRCWTKEEERPCFADIVTHHEALMDDDYIILDDYDEDDYGWLENYTMDERV